jgi:hypothetical protein
VGDIGDCRVFLPLHLSSSPAGTLTELYRNLHVKSRTYYSEFTVIFV